jgi:hypothetical protein
MIVRPLRDRVLVKRVEAQEDGPERLRDAFRGTDWHTVLAGWRRNPVRYALHGPRPNGGTEVTVVIDRPARVWWNSSAPSTPYRFSVVQIRFAKNGTSEGRLSLGVPVAADKRLGVALADCDKAPALLTDIRAEQLGRH